MIHTGNVMYISSRFVHRLHVSWPRLVTLYWDPIQEFSNEKLNARAFSTSNANKEDMNKEISSRDVFIVGVARTPLGSFLGGLSGYTAPELGAAAMRAALERSGIPCEAVGEVFLGHVCSAGVGQAPARQACLLAGIPEEVDGTAVNKVCSSGMKAVALGAQAISSGLHDVVVAGGMESMSNIPHYLGEMRGGVRLGNACVVDGLVHDGLTDAKYSIHMGLCADKCANEYEITRGEQDEHAIESFSKARKARSEGYIDWEIVPMEIRPGKGKKLPKASTSQLLAEDESLAKMNPEKLRQLPPYFNPDNGTVTAGNASPITDGAAALVLASKEAIDQFNIAPLGRIVSFADAAQNPMNFPTSPSRAIPKALQNAGITQLEVDYWEVNEAFSVVDIANRRIMGLDPKLVNVFGGSVALGHPIGASGARILVTLMNVLRVMKGRIGVAGICNGGGGASAMVIEKM